MVSPEKTLERIAPLLEPCGITRYADITFLDDDLGAPVYTAVRPTGLTLQTANGKGLTTTAAKVSALMEAIETYHAENPESKRFIRASAQDMRERGQSVFIPPRDAVDAQFYFSDSYIIDWIEADDLISRESVWVPACTAYFVEPTVYRTSTNGLASGNHPLEACLHGLYEVIERDSVSRQSVNGVLNLARTCRIVDLASIASEHLQAMISKIQAAGSQLVLIWVQAPDPVHVCWAVLLNHRGVHAVSLFNSGFGAHLDLNVAASRAVTEAIQSRLTMIQAARDDIVLRPASSRKDIQPGPAFRYFQNLQPNTHWRDLTGLIPQKVPGDLGGCLDFLLKALAKNGHQRVLRINLTQARLGVPVVKILVPTMIFQRELF